MKLQHPFCLLCLGAFAALWACESSPSNACPPYMLEQGGVCVLAEGEGGLPGQWCGESYVLFESDNRHCGGCNQPCEENQHCANGQCLSCAAESRLYAACFQTGHVAVLSSHSHSLVARRQVGANPQALSGMGEVLLCADDGAKQLWRLDAQTLEEVGEALETGATPIHVSTDEAHIYVVNAVDNTLQIVDSRTGQTRTEVYFGPNTSPQAFVRMGEWGFVPLYGNLFGDTAPGQRLVRLNLSNPDAPTLQGEADFSSLALYAQGGTALPLPYDVVHHQGALYVSLNHMDPETYAPASPGLIAKVHPQTLETTLIPLGDGCTNAVSLASNGKWLVVSCSGSYATGEGRGLALLADDEVKAQWAAPADFFPGVMAGKCDALWVANANGGDVHLFSTQGADLHVLRGAGGSEGGPVEACPEGPGYATVQSLWLKP